MKTQTSSARSYRNPIQDRLRPIYEANASKLPGVILFAAGIGIFPIAYALDGLMDLGWLGAAFGALAIAAILAVGGCALVRR